MIKDQLTKNNTVGPNTREIEKLRKVFPHYFDKNGDFMIDRLKELLSSTDVEMRKEGYELKFLGKSYAKLLTSTETKTVLTPIIEHNTKGISNRPITRYLSNHSFLQYTVIKNKLDDFLCHNLSSH